jgi:hypothetical protein
MLYALNGECYPRICEHCRVGGCVGLCRAAIARPPLALVATCGLWPNASSWPGPQESSCCSGLLGMCIVQLVVDDGELARCTLASHGHYRMDTVSLLKLLSTLPVLNQYRYDHGDRFSENRRTLQCASATSATCLSEARPTRCKMHPACGHHLPSTPALTGECTELHRHGHPLPCRAHHPSVTSRNPSKHTEA